MLKARAAGLVVVMPLVELASTRGDVASGGGVRHIGGDATDAVTVTVDTASDGGVGGPCI